jgi:hypothetical protein
MQVLKIAKLSPSHANANHKLKLCLKAELDLISVSPAFSNYC